VGCYGDADDFGSGAVMVGFYPTDDEDNEGVCVCSPMAVDGPREAAIVGAVRRVLDLVFQTSSGVDWAAVSEVVCWPGWCRDAGADDLAREWQDEHPDAVAASWRVQAETFVRACGIDPADYVRLGNDVMYEAGVFDDGRYEAALGSRFWWLLDGCSDRGDTLYMLDRAFGIAEL